MFLTKYEKSTDDTKVLLMYLRLNDYDLSKVKRLEQVEENRQFDLKIKKIYGVTQEYVDVPQIEKEIENIVCPIICSEVQSYECYSNEPIIYIYTAQSAEQPLLINDMSVISKAMLVTRDCIISSHKARPVTECDEKGFMFFYNYVLYEKCVISGWRMEYGKDKVFRVSYRSEDSDKELKDYDTLFEACEIDKTSTYKLVLYIIKKVSKQINEWKSDNFKAEKYKLINGNSH